MRMVQAETPELSKAYETLVNADQKTKAAALHELYKPLRTLVQVLDSDVQYAREQWRPDH